MFDLVKIEKKAKRKGMTIYQALDKAKIYKSTWYRWKNGSNDPSIRLLKRLIKVVS